MRKDKHLALKMRQQGMSYKKIGSELSIPISTLSDWFRDLEWSQDLKRELTQHSGEAASKAQKKRWEEWRDVFRKEAHKEFPTLIKNPLFTAGLMLYWGEGDSRLKNGMVRLVNTDSRMISLFCSFLRKVIKVEEQKVKAYLVLYSDLSDQECKKYWSNSSKIPIERFGKTQFIQGRHPTRRTTYGMCTVCISSRGLKEKIAIWIDLLYKMYSSEYQ